MKNWSKVFIPLFLFSNTVLATSAEELKGISISPKARFDFMIGALDNKGMNSSEKISPNHHDFGFLSQGRFVLNIQNKLDNNITYGAQVAVQTTSRPDRNTPTHLFFESDAGKFELGADKSVTTKMKITGYSQSAATGGLWDVWVRPDIRNKDIQYVTNASNFLDSKSRNVKHTEYSRKVSYYTPKISGFQFGVSYIPDTTNIGAEPLGDDDIENFHMNKIVKGYKFDIKDGVGLGVTKEHNVNDDLSVKLSLVGEYGKVVPKKPTIAEINKDPNNPLVDPEGAKFKKLQTYNIGAEVKYGKLGFAASYANFNKSLTSNNPLIDPADRKNTHIYTIGSKYGFEKLNLSANYFHSTHKKNVVEALTLGADYKLASGILPYAEVTYFKAKGAYKAKHRDTQYIKDKHNGLLLLMGIRMEI